MEEKEVYSNLYELTNKESGIIVYNDDTAIITNWLSYDGIPRLFAGSFIGLGEDLEIESIKDLTIDEMKQFVEQIKIYYDPNDDLPDLLKETIVGKLYTLTSGERIITPEGWH